MDMYLRRQPWDDLGHVSFDQLLQPVAHRAVELVGASEVEGERLGVVALKKREGTLVNFIYIDR